MVETSEQLSIPLPISKSIKNIRFRPLKPNNLPIWTDNNFEPFVRKWLEESAVEMDRLHKKDYNIALQSLVSKAFQKEIGEGNSGETLSDFKTSVCLYLDFLQ